MGASMGCRHSCVTAFGFLSLLLGGGILGLGVYVMTLGSIVGVSEVSSAP